MVQCEIDQSLNEVTFIVETFINYSCPPLSEKMYTICMNFHKLILNLKHKI
jgi:hypothetical protein